LIDSARNLFQPTSCVKAKLDGLKEDKPLSRMDLMEHSSRISSRWSINCFFSNCYLGWCIH